MNELYLKKLEFDKILENLSSKCSTYIGKSMATLLKPSSDPLEVQKLLNQTSEAVNLIYRNSTPSIYDIQNINLYIKIIEGFGTLSAKSLLDIGIILKNAKELKDYFFKDYIDPLDFPLLNEYFSRLYSNEGILKKITDSIIDENTISDNASPNLNAIRKNKRKLEQEIKDKLNAFVHSQSYSKYIQESVVTTRNDRFVIPVKEEYKSKIKGFVHDISSSGSTVFIEPISIFEMNNQINNLKLEENLEIEKILQQLTATLIPYTNELNNNCNLIGKLDFIFAKAKYSIEIKANCPKISKQKSINLINARHPLINPKDVVPINLNLGQDFDILVITGPNTGGKTVTLKTVGLLNAMALSGLHIPADIGSSIYVFDHIFADIGDDQNILESLSTFSSHISNIVKILKSATKDSLVLLDELGSGTDPLEGANLAISILEEFKNIGALTISTTHYQELKKYALVNDRFINASVEFDIEKLKPTYKLLIGIPGKSNAFEISKKLGISKKIINRATSYINSNDLNIEDILKEISDNKSEIEQEKMEIVKTLEKAKDLNDSLKVAEKDLKIKENKIISDAKIEARKILLDAKDTVNDIIKNLPNSSKNEANKYRDKLNSSIKDLSINDASILSDNINFENNLPLKEIKPNTRVYIADLDKEGTIISNISKSNKVKVQVESIKINVPIQNLRKCNSKEKISSSVSVSSLSKSKHVNTQINVIGLTVDEAIPIIDKYIDDCILAKLSSARIIHGKGTGALKKGIWDFLKNKKEVKSFRIGSFGEGEMGATIINF